MEEIRVKQVIYTQRICPCKSGGEAIKIQPVIRKLKKFWRLQWERDKLIYRGFKESETVQGIFKVNTIAIAL